MTEEIKEVSVEEPKKEKKEFMSDEYKRFLLTILASFLGCLVALCLYGATIKPTFSPPPINPYYQMQRFDHDKFYKKPPISHIIHPFLHMKEEASGRVFRVLRTRFQPLFQMRQRD